ncbi:hypothetical protein ANN_05629 [Periplaneta americana]|uniref:Uncharacterized protein n=1 Tax=Periplaneta americana TaxID=6978 RepID=A0ABQ8TD84_PERAM|nr:hypothetical protein ANN_05629 [Periplaneta americana]
MEDLCEGGNEPPGCLKEATGKRVEEETVHRCISTKSSIGSACNQLSFVYHVAAQNSLTCVRYYQVVVITDDVQNVHLLLEYRPHIDVSLTCEHDPKLQEYCVCPQNMPRFDSERIPNQAPETNKPMILNGPTSRNREGSDQRCITYEAEMLPSKYGVHFEESYWLNSFEGHHISFSCNFEVISFIGAL